MKTILSSVAFLPSRRLRSRKLVTSVFALTATFGALTTAALSARAGGPVGDSPNGGTDLYANVSNPFGPEMSLLRDDDLVLTLGNEARLPANAGMQNNWLSTVSTQSSQGTECTYATCPKTFYEYDYEQPPTVGRFFNIATDTIVQSPASSNTTDFYTWWLNGNAGAYQPGNVQPLPYGTNATTTSISAVADFNGDGYDDLLEVYSDYSVQTPANGRARILTANDVNQPTQGFAVSPETDLGFPYGARSVAVGDFNGDGHPDVAVLFVDNDNNPNIEVYSVDQSFHFTPQATYVAGDPIQQGQPDAPLQLATGTFTPGGGQQLVMASVPASLGKLKVRIYDFTYPGLPYYPTEHGNVVTTPVNRIKLATGRFDWTSPVDSLVVLSTNSPTSSQVDLLTVDPATEIPSVAGTLDVAKDLFNSSDTNYVGLDIAIGNFDNVSTPVPTDGGAPQRDPNLQLAIATAYRKGTNSGQLQFQVKDLFFYDVNPQGATGVDGGLLPLLSRRSTMPIKTVDGGQGNVTRMAIAAADLHGRSMRLGPGWRVEEDKTSPTMILAQPPSHIDYIPNADGGTLHNATLSPSGFNAGYSTTNGTSSSNSQTSSHGWAVASTEKLSESVRLGTKSDNYTVAGSFSAEQAFSKRTDNTYGSLSTTTQTISQRTTMNDVLSFDDVTSYLYAYEVIGQKVCPEGQTTCDDSAKVPMTVSFSATGSDSANLAAADSAAWYQPVWENGNVLSYPGNQAQLMLDVANPAIVSDTTTLTTGSSATTISTTWTGQQNESNKVDSAKKFTEDGNLSIGASSSVAVAAETTNLDLDLTGSTSFDDLKTKDTSISQSSTFTLNASTHFKEVYGYTPVVFGQNAPPNYFDPGDPNASWASPVNAQGLTVFGPTRTAYYVDPLSDANNDAFWKQTYGPTDANGNPGAFDVALNHPYRWRDVTLSTVNLTPDNCLPMLSGYMDCVSEKPRNPANPMVDAFHKMRGFFIYKTADVNLATPANQGLQVESATTGDQLTLEARVYNYSLNPMPAGTRVRARFYAMPWNSNNDFPSDYVSPSQPGGASSLIGEWSGSGIQPFNTDTPIPNYVVASVPFDTSSYTGTLVFWVVVWAEDANGNMIQELPGKGLTSSPTSTLDGGAARGTFVDVADLEPTVPNNFAGGFASDPATTSFSNNIGFFPGTLTIIPPSLGAGLGTTGAPVGSVSTLSVPSLELGRVEVQQGEETTVSATVHNSGNPMAHATVYFYDGDPGQGGTIVGARRLPFIDGSTDQTVRVEYAPATCGLHEVYVKITHAGQSAPATKAIESIQVDCGANASDGGVTDSGVTDGGVTDGGDAGTAGPGGGGSDGGCSMAPGGAPAESMGWLASFGAALGALGARRKRKA